jgi:hypothetical protein
MKSAAARSRPVVVFTGPTLSPFEAQQVFDAIYLPPAAQGSVIGAVQSYGPRAILIIDGVFQGEPAVRHKEILWAISQGVTVVGAASMGALRAAELFPNMLGVGLVYRWYRRFAFAPDDAVAVLHGPAEVNCAALTLAEIDLRMTFRAAERRRLISRDLRIKLDAAARRLNFRERTLARIVAEALPRDGSREMQIRMLKAALVEQKKNDARLALRLLASGGFSSPPRPVDFLVTTAFARDLEDSGLSIAFEAT